MLLLIFGFVLSKTVFTNDNNVFHHLIVGLSLICGIITLPAVIIGLLCGGISIYFLLLFLVLILFTIRYLHKNLSLATVRIFSFRNFMFFTPILLLFMRHLLLLTGGGILGWDSLWGYLPWSHQFSRLGYIPSFDIQRPGYPLGKPPAAMLLNAFSYSLAPGFEVSPAISLLFIIGLGAISGAFVHKMKKSYNLSTLAMIITMSLPIYDYFSYRWGTYIDLPLSFFYLSSIYFLIQALDGKTKAVPLFWISFTMGCLTKETMLALVFTYFIVFAYRCKERLVMILLAGLVPIGRIFLALIGVISFDWAPTEWIILSFLFFFSSQLLLKPKSEPKHYFADLVNLILDKSSLLVAIPIVWFIRSHFIGYSENLSSYLTLGLLSIPLFFAVYLLSNKKKLPQIRNERSHKLIRFTLLFTLFLVIIIGVYSLFSSSPIVTPENLTFIPFAAIIYFFLSNWFGSAYIIPHIIGLLKSFIGDIDEKMFCCLTFCLLAIWSNIGLTSIRYIAFIGPIITLFTISGLSIIMAKSTITKSNLSFALLVCFSIFYSSLHYELTNYPDFGLKVWHNDIFRNNLTISIGIIISILYVLLVFALTKTKVAIGSKLDFIYKFRIISISKVLVTLSLLFLVFTSILFPLQNSQNRLEQQVNSINMSYSQLLQDLADRYGASGTILTPIPTCGTTYWSNFSIINLNDKIQTQSLNLSSILSSKNLTLLHDFYRRYDVKFIILPKETNWYYETVETRFINQKEWIQKDYPTIELILESKEHFIPVVNYRYNMTLSNCNSTETWSGIGSLIVDDMDYKEGNSSLKHDGITKTDGWFFTHFNEEGVWDFSDRQYFVAWIKLNSSIDPTFFSIIFSSSNSSNYSTWHLHKHSDWDSGNWFKAVLPLGNPDGIFGNGVDLSAVNQITFSLKAKPETHAIFSVDHISLAKSITSVGSFTIYEPYTYYDVYLVQENLDKN